LFKIRNLQQMIFILFFELDRMWNFVTTKIIYNTSSSWEKRDTTWEMWIVDFITFVKLQWLVRLNLYKCLLLLVLCIISVVDVKCTSNWCLILNNFQQAKENKSVISSCWFFQELNLTSIDLKVE
jgi:hypothetical protein